MTYLRWRTLASARVQEEMCVQALSPRRHEISARCAALRSISIKLSFISDGRRSRNIGPEGDDGGRQKRLRISWLRSLAVLCVVAGETPIIAFYAVLSRSSRFPVKKKLDLKILLSVVQLR